MLVILDYEMNLDGDGNTEQKELFKHINYKINGTEHKTGFSCKSIKAAIGRCRGKSFPLKLE